MTLGTLLSGVVVGAIGVAVGAVGYKENQSFQEFVDNTVDGCVDKYNEMVEAKANEMVKAKAKVMVKEAKAKTNKK